MKSSKAKISLVIPAYNEEKYIEACLTHATSLSNRHFHEIIVVNNASTDRTKDVVEQFIRHFIEKNPHTSIPSIRIVTETEKGLTKARERGYREATGDILGYVDADTQMPDGWYERVAAEFDKNPNLACLSGPYIYHDIPNWKQVLVKIYWYMLGMPAYLIVGYMTIGGNFAIKKDVLKQMNGFDTSIAFYGEDTNIARRAHTHGKVKFSPAFIMYTSGRRLSDQGLWKISFLYISNFLSEVMLKRPITREYKDSR